MFLNGMFETEDELWEFLQKEGFVELKECNCEDEDCEGRWEFTEKGCGLLAGYNASEGKVQ